MTFLPIHIMLLLLSGTAGIATFFWAGSEVGQWATALCKGALLYLSSYATYFVLQKLGLASPTKWEHRVITTLILFLLFDASMPWLLFVALGAVTEIMRRLLRTASGPLLNPAATGALIASFVGFFPSWWGSDFPPHIAFLNGELGLITFIMVAVAGYVAYRYKRLPIIVCTIVCFALVHWILFANNPLFQIVNGMFLFYLFVMAVEPKTSPNTKQEQFIYGAILGLAIPVGNYLGSAEPYLLALVLANLYAGRKTVFSFFVSRLQPTQA